MTDQFTPNCSFQPIHLAIGTLAYHSMTPVWEPTLSRNYQEAFYSRGMWVKQPHDIMNTKDREKIQIKHQGLYVFGGLDKDRQCNSNTLYVIKPAYTQNKKNISIKSGAFKRLIKPRYLFEVSEVVAIGGGQPPCARSHHSAAMLGSRYLAIYGGRNDKMFHIVGNVALNDLHLFDLHMLQWEGDDHRWSPATFIRDLFIESSTD